MALPISPARPETERGGLPSAPPLEPLGALADGLRHVGDGPVPPYHEDPGAVRARPVAVEAIAILLWVIGAAGLLAAALDHRFVLAAEGLVLVTVSVAVLLLGAGCWHLVAWARPATALLAAFNAGVLIVAWLWDTTRIVPGRDVPLLVLSLAVASYLLGRQARRTFARADESRTRANPGDPSPGSPRL